MKLLYAKSKWEAAGDTLGTYLDRVRAMFSGPTTRALLEALPELHMTADFSQWFCVHESDLSDPAEIPNHFIP